MPFLPRLNSLWRKLFRKTQWDEDLTAELDAYLELLIDQRSRKV